MLRDSFYSRLGRLDAWLAIALGLLTFGVGAHYAPIGAYSGFVDMAHDGYQLRLATDLSHGAVVFRDTFDQYGPLSGYLNALGLLTLGHTLLAIKYFVAGWYGLIGIAMYVLARHWLRPVLAAFSVLVWLGLAPFYQHGIMISPHVYVLLLQTVATILVLESAEFEPRAFLIAGILTGLSSGMKQTMGMLYAGAILAYLSSLLVLQHERWRQIARAGASFAAGYAGLVAVLVTWLWSRGALHDWYLQTIAFPREFYVGGGGVSVQLAQLFFWMQVRQPACWIVIRAVVFATALVSLFRGRVAEDLLLVASITGFLWLGAFPSANFMHQWWTASLSIPVFVAGTHQLARWMSRRHEIIAALGTMAVIALLVRSEVAARLEYGEWRAAAYTRVITEPPVLRGIRTLEPTQRALSTAFHMMTEYRRHHPGTKVISMNPSRVAPGVAVDPVDESILFVSFLDDNTHSWPVYWSLPVLSTKIYPDYFDNSWAEIRATHPLIVEYRRSEYKPASVPGYFLLLGAEADLGYWYIYAPDHAEREQHGEASVFLPREQPVAPPVVVVPPAPSEVPIGQWRGLVERPAGAVNTYSWPSDLPDTAMAGRTQPFTDEPVGRVDIVHRTAPDVLEVDGNAQAPFSYLAQYGDKQLVQGTRLLIRGELFEGGLQAGFQQNTAWCCSVTITRRGPFEAVIQIPRSGTYQLVVANDLETTSKWDLLRAHWLRGAWHLLRGSYLPNRFSISRIAWMPS